MKYHFIAIGGSIMHNLALNLAQQGHSVTGSDDVIYDPAASRLKNAGLLPESFGWFPEKITTDLDFVVLGMHAKPDNPELAKAQKTGVPILSFPELIYQQTKQQKRVVIAGSHGKTTITSMVMEACRAAAKEFNYAVGALLPDYDVMTRLKPEVPIAIIEGDEYLTSPIDPRPKFLHYNPDILLLSGIAWDHMNAFPTFETYLAAFEKLLQYLKSKTQVVYCEADPKLAEMVNQYATNCELHPYHSVDYQISNGRFHLVHDGKLYPLKIFGTHNMQNMAGAWRVAQLLEISDADFIQAMQQFMGADKRLQPLAENESVSVYRDFAHAPSKVRASVSAVKELYPERPVTACVELHTYSSLNPSFLPEYTNTLDQADSAIVFINPEALAAKGDAIDEEQVKRAFGKEGLLVTQDKNELERMVQEHTQSPGTLLLMSSGHFGGIDLPQLATFVAHPGKA